jgi:hypothetical protein
MPSPVSASILSLLFLTVVLVGCDSDGTSSGVPDVEGVWFGTAILPNPFNAAADFEQRGRAISGTMRITAAFPESPVIGEIDELSRLTWRVQNGCERWEGTLTIRDEEPRLSGPITLDGSACPTPTSASGTLRLCQGGEGLCNP